MFVTSASSEQAINQRSTNFRHILKPNDLRLGAEMELVEIMLNYSKGQENESAGEAGLNKAQRNED